MAKTFKLEILSPTTRLFDGEVVMLNAPGSDGQFGVLYDHAAMLAGLEFGVLTARMPDGKDRYFVINDGFFEVRKNRAVVLVDTCEAAENIDVARAKAARERAEKRLASPAHEVDIERAKAALLRALTRMKAASLAGKN